MMAAYFLLVELFFFIFTVYILIRKKELSIIYLPVLFFSRNIFIPSTRAMIWYMILVVIIGYAIYMNRGFSRNNPYAILLVIYFTILLFYSTDPAQARAYYTYSVVLFLSVPLIHNLYKIYNRSFIESEIYKMCYIVLLLFISNTMMATLTGYTGGRDMYGLGGIYYGHLYASNFNILPIALFFILYQLSKRYSTMDILIAVVSVAFMVLSMRRGVMVAAIAAAGIFVFMLTIQKNKSNAFVTVYAIGIVIIMTFLYTDLIDTFWNRFEGRGLEERAFVSTTEGRFVEYGLLYIDMFIREEYSPIFGFELFNSGGNYGNQIFGARRSLHSDIPVILHASGCWDYYYTY
jgi:hypothetical protein